MFQETREFFIGGVVAVVVVVVVVAAQKMEYFEDECFSNLKVNIRHKQPPTQKQKFCSQF